MNNVWRRRLKDGRGGGNAADEIILTTEGNFLNELKRTNGLSISLNDFRPNQVQGCIDFDTVLPWNYGLIFASFLNEGKGIDEAYAFRMITWLRYLKQHDTNHMKLEDLKAGKIPVVQLPLLEHKDRRYDLEGVVKCCKSL